MKPKINFLFAEQTFGSHMFVCTLTPPGQNLDADLSENRTGFGVQNLPNVDLLQIEIRNSCRVPRPWNEIENSASQVENCGRKFG